MLVLVSLLVLCFLFLFFSFSVGPGNAVGGCRAVVGSSLPVAEPPWAFFKRILGTVGSESGLQESVGLWRRLCHLQRLRVGETLGNWRVVMVTAGSVQHNTPRLQLRLVSEKHIKGKIRDFKL